MGTLVDIERGERLLDEHLDLDGLELCSVASGLFQEGDPHGYEELLNAIRLVQRRRSGVALFTGVWQLLQLSGWVGDFQHCWQCGKQVDESSMMSWRGSQLSCSACGQGMMVSAGLRKGIAAHLVNDESGANVRLGQQELSCWQRMIQDVLREHGVRPLSTVDQV